MDRLSSELLHTIASLLSPVDLVSFRLVSRSFAQIGAAHLLPEVTFEAHEQELARLRAIARHPVLSRHVRSLVYISDMQQQPPVELGPYVDEYQRARRLALRNSDLTARDLGDEYNMSQAELEEAHRSYVAAARNQQNILVNRRDIDALRDEVLPRLARSLRAFTVTESYKFEAGAGRGREGRRRRMTPHRDMVHSDLLLLDRPYGGRFLEALLKANADAVGARCEDIESVRASSVHWDFFERDDPAELRRLFAPLAATLKCLELGLSIEDYGDEGFDARDAIEQVEAAMANGHVRDALATLVELDTLALDFGDYVGESWPGPVAVLGHLVAPGFRWQNLRCLTLGSVHCPRQELEAALQLHRGTLRELCLRDFGLERTSWRRFLPWVRNNMDLSDACICGYLEGRTEEGDDEGSGVDEYWCLESPLSNPHGMRCSLNMYCRRRGKCYPDKLPLSADVVLEYYDEWVAAEFPRGDKFRVWTEVEVHIRENEDSDEDSSRDDDPDSVDW
ncbi:hypothetical protein SLS62_008632 [Diatrype stigma]|uniref:F-box domain-containing protein n=1 Tax=Diatrype stigma TaxID=117547 RepID=A0AAN9YN02_9PEZI